MLDKRKILGAGATFLLFAAHAAHADQAIVVGIDHYTNIPAAQLAGPINDAQSMADKLTEVGFKVTMLTDKDATKEGILNALRRMKSLNTDDQRFVFYYAGHGYKAPDGIGYLLPSDISSGSVEKGLSKDELYDALKAVPARSRTVLLDSCFSGAMMRAFTLKKGLHPHLKTRYFDLNAKSRGITQKKLEVVNDRDAPPAPRGDTSVCYFAAAADYQRAYEDDIDGKPSGFFTHFLVKHLSTTKEPWSAVQTDVSGNVASLSDAAQTPQLSASYVDVQTFEGKDTPAPPAPPTPPTPTDDPTKKHQGKTVWDEFSEDRADPSKLKFEMTPNRSTVATNEKFKFAATIGDTGYLVVMEFDTDKNLDLVFPMSLKAEDGQVQTGDSVLLPKVAGKAYRANKEGTERVKAILFSSREAAQALLAQFPQQGANKGTIASSKVAKNRFIEMTDEDKKQPFYTSAVGFEVSAQ